MHNYGLWRFFFLLIDCHHCYLRVSLVIRNLTSVPFPVPLQSPDNSKLSVSPIKESSNFRVSVP